MTSHAEESKQLLASAEDRLKAASPTHLIEFERIQLAALLSIAHGVQALIELQGFPVFVKTEGTVKGRKSTPKKGGTDGTA